MSIDSVVEDLIARGMPQIGNRGILVLVWGPNDTSYRANIKPELVPAILRALAHNLAPVQKDGSSTYVVNPDGSKTKVPDETPLAKIEGK